MRVFVSSHLEACRWMFEKVHVQLVGGVIVVVVLVWRAGKVRVLLVPAHELGVTQF